MSDDGFTVWEVLKLVLYILYGLLVVVPFSFLYWYFWRLDVTWEEYCREEDEVH